LSTPFSPALACPSRRRFISRPPPWTILAARYGDGIYAESYLP
jgi:hypothetical protein